MSRHLVLNQNFKLNCLWVKTLTVPFVYNSIFWPAHSLWIKKCLHRDYWGQNNLFFSFKLKTFSEDGSFDSGSVKQVACKPRSTCFLLKYCSFVTIQALPSHQLSRWYIIWAFSFFINLHLIDCFCFAPCIAGWSIHQIYMIVQQQFLLLLSLIPQ